jgi:hypothetical protein
MTPLARFQFELRNILVLAAIVLIGGAATADAQQYPLRLPEGTSAKPQRATSPKPRVEEADPRYPANPLYPAHPVAFTYIPAIMMSDGTVWANFGYGYVQVRNACARPGRVIDSRGASTTTASRRETRDSYCYTRTPQGSLVVTR